MRLHSHIRWTLISKTGVWVCVIDQLCGSQLIAQSVTGLMFLNGPESLALNDYIITTESLNNFDKQYIGTGALFSLSIMNEFNINIISPTLVFADESVAND